MKDLTEKLTELYNNRIIKAISNYFPLLIVINHFTDSLIVCFIALFLFSMIASFTPFDIPLTIIFSLLGCWWVISDGYSMLVVVLYLILVVPKLIVLAINMKSLR